MMRAKTMLLLFTATVLAGAQPAVPIRWACIGNSITEGMGATTAYPARLAGKLGPAFKVENDGVSARTLLKKGDYPYWTQGKLANVFAFKPDIITLKLGTNDTKPGNWKYGADFARDLGAMVDTLSGLPSRPQIWLCLPVPIFPNTYGINNAILRDSIIPLIRQLSGSRGLNLIDLYTPLANHPELFPDGVHPNDAGADSIASLIYRAYAAQAARIACIGNSITQYAYPGAASGAVPENAYPVKLNMLLGRGYLVENDGVSGTAMQKKNAMPYWTYGKLSQVFKFRPQTITIKLGTNDSRAPDWNGARYLADYKAMIDTLSGINPKPRILLCLPLPAWKVNGAWPWNGINGDIIRDSVLPAIRRAAQEKGLTVIDAHTPFQSTPALVPDGVHPNAAGQDTLAHILSRALKDATVSGRPAHYPEARPPARHSRIDLNPRGPSPVHRAGEKRFSLQGETIPPDKLPAAAPEVRMERAH